jgi:hypothetical protein
MQRKKLVNYGVCLASIFTLSKVNFIAFAVSGASAAKARGVATVSVHEAKNPWKKGTAFMDALQYVVKNDFLSPNTMLKKAVNPLFALID